MSEWDISDDEYAYYAEMQEDHKRHLDEMDHRERLLSKPQSSGLAQASLQDCVRDVCSTPPPLAFRTQEPTLQCSGSADLATTRPLPCSSPQHALPLWPPAFAISPPPPVAPRQHVLVSEVVDVEIKPAQVVDVEAARAEAPSPSRGSAPERREAPSVEAAEPVAHGQQASSSARRFAVKKKRPPTEAELEARKKLRVEQALEDALNPADPVILASVATGTQIDSKVYEAIRKAWIAEYMKEHIEEAKENEGNVREYRQLIRQKFTKTTLRGKLKLLQKLIDASPPESPELTGYVQARRLFELRLENRSSDDGRVHAKVVMLVYQHDSLIVEALQAPKGGQHLAMKSLVYRLQELPFVEAVARRFFEFAARKAVGFGAQWAASVEVCTKTYRAEGICRLHLSVVLGRDLHFNFKLPWEQMSFGKLLGVYKPSANADVTKQVCKKRGMKGMFAQASYYLQMPKIGLVASAGSWKPFADFKVKDSWITDYVQVYGCQFIFLGFHIFVPYLFFTLYPSDAFLCISISILGRFWYGCVSIWG